MANVMLWWQRFLLWASYTWHGLTLRGSRKRTITWVVGTDEVASMVTQIARAIPGSYSVSFQRLHYYAADTAYDYSIAAPVGTPRHARTRKFFGPLLLGRLAHEAAGIVYVGGTGFLVSYDDGRDYEMKWAKRHGLKVVCYWTGSDIRSLRLMKDLESELELPNIATYIELVVPGLGSDDAEAARRRLAVACDRRADAIFNFNVDQKGYLERSPEPFMFYLDADASADVDKHLTADKPVVVHATTSPIIKGTPLVRAAVAALRDEGYEFEYVELMGVSNVEVRAQLARAHISLNQFYGFTPTVFGMESLLAGAAVMMSADRELEPGIPAGAEDAWLVTRHWQVYDHLKMLLDDPALRLEKARTGQQWARENGTAKANGPRLLRILDEVLAGTYDEPVTYGPRA